jgi:type II secretion system protein I
MTRCKHLPRRTYLPHGTRLPRRNRPWGGTAAPSGFTLIEVLVALVIVALGMSALLETLSASANNIGALRDKTVAEWIAMNEIANARLALSQPPIGITNGDVRNCADGDWHWQRQIAAVDAVPGLYSITVSVRRAPPGSANSSSGNSNSNSDSSPPGSSSLGAPTLGAGSAIGVTGCIDTTSPGESLGSGSLGAGASGSLGASGTLGASSTLGPANTLGSGNSTTLGASGTGASGASGTSGAGNAGTIGSLFGAGAGAGSGQSWLITLTGFRGNSLGAASGESPDWTGSTFAGESGRNGIPNGGTTTGNLSSPAAPSQITAP